jgi:hypothetical protein
MVCSAALRQCVSESLPRARLACLHVFSFSRVALSTAGSGLRAQQGLLCAVVLSFANTGSVGVRVRAMGSPFVAFFERSSSHALCSVSGSVMSA